MKGWSFTAAGNVYELTIAINWFVCTMEQSSCVWGHANSKDRRGEQCPDTLSLYNNQASRRPQMHYTTTNVDCCK